MKYKTYTPPFKISSKVLTLVADICEKLGQLSVLEPDESLRLRRINKIKTVQGSLAIEGNTLNEEQISALLDGKVVIAPAFEIQEAHNAIKAYEELDDINPLSENDLLKSHSVLMNGLLEGAGAYRRKGAGISNGNVMIHIAPGADMVPGLMTNLFDWLNSTDVHPLIASCVFHYEFEFIHPFEDGNGRMGRLWQTAILNGWKSIFAGLPVENMIYRNQKDYYRALNASTQSGSSTPFIEFMLQIISDTIQSDQVNDQVSDQVNCLISVMSKESYKAVELMDLLGLSHRPTFRKNYLRPALEMRLIERTIPDKPNSRLQKYRLTAKGKQYKGNSNDI